MADNISPPEDFHSSLLDAGEERYRAFIANSSEGIWRFELEEPVETVLAADEQIELFYRRGYLAECNDAMARMYGYARAEEIVGARLGDLLVRTDPANVEYLRAFVASGYRLTDVESVERDRDGRIKHFSNNLVGVVEGGKILRAWGTQRDSTERKLIEEEARRLADIVEATTDFVAVTGADARLVYINRAGRRMVGVAEDADAQEFVGGSLSPEWAYERTVREWLPRALAEGSASGEGALRTLEGKEIPVSFVMLVHRDAAGEPLYVSTIARDITERKRAEAERELLLARERAARTAAEEANRLKDEFLATLSHELRTPLTAILGWAHMLKAGGLDEATALHAVETVERNALAQRQLVEDVLDVSRIVTGQLRIEQTAVGLLDVVRAALDSVRPAADAKRIELQCSFDPRAGQVAGDPARLQQVVWNLLSNAVKFTPAGGAVRIAVERLLAQTRITISDTGQGITPDFLPYVFERFRQADQSTTRQHGGLGLGLAIVRHLVEEHGGSVHAYSAGAGQGATFTVDLPRQRTARVPTDS